MGNVGIFKVFFNVQGQKKDSGGFIPFVTARRIRNLESVCSNLQPNECRPTLLDAVFFRK